MDRNNEVRQLAGIMFTDIVGFTRMMGEDESRTREILLRQRELVYPLIDRFEGRILKEMGDGLLVMFTSVIKAVRCAVEIQNCEKEFALRIGIHIGDVVIENGDVFGSGVNIASRVESLASPGSICITADVWHQINNQTDISVRSLGLKQLKGVREPIEIFEISKETIRPAETGAAGGRRGSKAGFATPVKWFGRPDRFFDVSGHRTKKITLPLLFVLAAVAATLIWYSFSPKDVLPEFGPSIAVLPLENLSPDPDDAFFTNGIHEDIITQLAKIEDLKVIARSSVISYVPAQRNVRQIAGELGVATVLEGSVRRAGDRVRVAVQLINTETSQAIWAETFDRNLIDLFAIQSEIAQEIASALRITLRTDEKESIERRPTTNSEAYDLYLRGREYENRPGYALENLEIAEQMYERAVEIDPDFALAYARLASVNATIYWFRDVSPERGQKSYEYTERSLSLIPDLPEALHARGLYYYWVETDYDKALETLQRALVQLPNDAEIVSIISAVQRRMGLWDESIANTKKAIELNPRLPNYPYQLALTYKIKRDYESADKWFDRTLTLAPDFQLGKAERALMMFKWKGDLETYRNELHKLIDLERTHPNAWWYFNLIARNLDYLLEITPSAETQVFESANAYHLADFVIAKLYILKGDNERAEPYLASAIEELENRLAQAPDDPRIHASLGRIYGLSGQKEKAVAHGNRAIEITPLSKDALIGAQFEFDMASTYSYLGDAENSVRHLETLLAIPSNVSINWLRTFPGFDFIRSTPEFEQLISTHQ